MKDQLNDVCDLSPVTPALALEDTMNQSFEILALFPCGAKYFTVVEYYLGHGKVVKSISAIIMAVKRVF